MKLRQFISIRRRNSLSSCLNKKKGNGVQWTSFKTCSMIWAQFPQSRVLVSSLFCSTLSLRVVKAAVQVLVLEAGVVSALVALVRMAVLECLRQHRRQREELGLFGSKTKSTGKHVGFLERADEAYTKAFATKNTAGLDTYFTRACLTKMLERIRMSERAYSGLERYKHVTWRVESNDGTSAVYVKTVTYDNVKISKGISAPVGSDYVERWTLVDENGKTKVSQIRRSA